MLVHSCSLSKTSRENIRRLLSKRSEKHQHELCKNYGDIITNIKIELSTPRCALFTLKFVTYATGRYINNKKILEIISHVGVNTSRKTLEKLSPLETPVTTNLPVKTPTYAFWLIKSSLDKSRFMGLVITTIPS